MGKIDPFVAAPIENANVELLWLLGQPHLGDYLHFVKNKVVGGRAIDPITLTDEWRTANDVYHQLEQDEEGLADTAEALPLDPALAPKVEALRAHPWFRATFDRLPTTVEMVELDKLIVYQISVSNLFSGTRAQGLGASPAPADLFDFCLPVDRDNPPVKVERLSGDRWMFTSPSTDLRSHEARPLGAAQLAAFDSSGPVAGGIALLVGFGCNFMSVVRSDNRMVLHNGYHRACALRALGVTHAPAIIQDVTRKDELKIAASESVNEDPAFYFLAKRPPMLKDFFDPRIAKKLMVRPIQHSIEIEFKFKDYSRTDWSE
ncbi:MAG TPA: hypothetical protein VH331_13810 [Allosphingosinicella sp.]|nr:hypothetical protein [Allosphingosinicella sp.]